MSFCEAIENSVPPSSACVGPPAWITQHLMRPHWSRDSACLEQQDVESGLGEAACNHAAAGAASDNQELKLRSLGSRAANGGQNGQEGHQVGHPDHRQLI